MNKDVMDKVKKITSMISHLYGWYFEAEKMDEEDEITISYEQGVDDAGIPGNILKIVINEMEKIGFCFSRVSFKGNRLSDFEGDHNTASEGTFKCVKCGKDADIRYVGGYEFARHINGEPEDGHFPVPPEQTDDDEVY